MTKPAALNVTALSELKGLSSGAHRLLIGLLTFRNRETGRCSPGLKRLRDRLGGVPERTACRWLAELRSKGLVEVERRPGKASFYGLCATPTPQAESTAAKCGNTPKCGAAISGFEGTAISGVEGTAISGVLGGLAPYLLNQTLIELTEAAEPDRAGNPNAAAAAAASTIANIAPENRTPPAPDLAEALAEELLQTHPQPGRPAQAAVELKAILRESPDPVATAQKIRESHRTYVPFWATLPPERFIPQLWRWLREGEWKTPAITRKGVKSETTVERRERELRECDESSYRMYAELEMWEALEKLGQDPEVWRDKIKSIA